MKKILMAVIVFCLAAIGGAYFYFFMMSTPSEKLPPTATATIPATKPATAFAQTSSVTKALVAVQPAQPAKPTTPPVTAKAVVQPKIEPKKPEPVVPSKPEETKKKEPIKAKKETKPLKTDTPKKEETKITVAPIDKPKKTARVPKHFKLIKFFPSATAANEARDKMSGQGYHTATVREAGGSNIVVLEPFTDKDEAVFVSENISKDTGVKGFAVKPVY